MGTADKFLPNTNDGITYQGFIFSVAGEYQIVAEESSENGEGDFVVTHLRVTYKGESRSVTHFQFVSWPDYGVPDSALSMLTFLQRVRETQAEKTQNMNPRWDGHPLGPPMVVHCSAGNKMCHFCAKVCNIHSVLDNIIPRCITTI